MNKLYLQVFKNTIKDPELLEKLDFLEKEYVNDDQRRNDAIKALPKIHDTEIDNTIKCIENNEPVLLKEQVSLLNKPNLINI